VNSKRRVKFGKGECASRQFRACPERLLLTMFEELRELIKKLESDRSIASFNETQTKQAIVQKILHILGWDIFDGEEVVPEFTTHGKRVDYALRQGDNVKVFIEVKRIGEDLDKHQEQLLQYSFQEGIELAVLTNGIAWWLYLPMQKGNWTERKFCVIQIDGKRQDSDEKARRLLRFLSKDQITTGGALADAENEHKKRLAVKDVPRVAKKVTDLFPETFVSDHPSEDETFIDLILDELEHLHGVRLGKSDVIGLLQNQDKKGPKGEAGKQMSEIKTTKSHTLDKAKYFEKIVKLKSRQAPSMRFTGSLRGLYDTIVKIVTETGLHRLGGDAISKRYNKDRNLPESASLPILPTDVCYNMVNLADQETKFLLRRDIGDFEFVDLNYVNDREERITWTLGRKGLSDRLKGKTYPDIGVYRKGHYYWNEDELKRLGDDIRQE
jgi:predicted type IV restriction endonuclease